MNRLIIYDGPDEQSMKIGEVYGNSNNKLLKSISSSGKTLFIDFKKHDMSIVNSYTLYQDMFGNEMTEFEASIMYNKIISACQSWLDIKSNILTSPNHSNSSNCTWLITSNFGFYIILNFKFIEVGSKIRAHNVC